MAVRVNLIKNRFGKRIFVPSSHRFWFLTVLLLKQYQRRKKMSGIIKKLKRKVAEDTSGDHSGEHNVNAYLEGKLSGADKKKFASHAGNCKECLEAIITWHYENIVSEMESKISDNDDKNTDWRWQGRNAQINETSALFRERNSQIKNFH